MIKVDIYRLGVGPLLLTRPNKTMHKAHMPLTHNCTLTFLNHIILFLVGCSCSLLVIAFCLNFYREFPVELCNL
jgi:hypothetical protein